LLVRIRDASDQDSWQMLVGTYAPLVYRFCRRRGVQDADAVEIVQEVMTEVARCIGSFDYRPERGRFRDWLGTITRRRLVRFWKKKNSREVAVDSETVVRELERTAGPTVDAEWIDEFNTRIVKVALERIRQHFDPATWQAFERVWLQDQASREASAQLNLPITAVYKAKSRVLKRLEQEVLMLAEDVPQFGA
jgi:RNA polymerase sigma-70 factor (ECF subfamily)